MLIAREHVGLSQPAAAQVYTISNEKEVERAERRQRDPNPGEQLRVRGGDGQQPLAADYPAPGSPRHAP